MTDDRRITRMIAGHLHRLGEAAGRRILGVRYESKLVENCECFALWSPPALDELDVLDVQPITIHTPELVRAAQLLGITLEPSPPPRS